MLDNISENLIRQFLLEQAIANGRIRTLREFEYINQEYEEYKNGKLKVDQQLFLTWLEEKQENSKLFGQFLLTNGFIQKRDYATEITSDATLSCTKDLLLSLRRTLILSPVGEGYTSSYKATTQRGILIINGVYFNQRNYMMKVNFSNNFVAGFIEGTNERYNELLLDYYERLQAALRLLRPIEPSILDSKVKLIEKDKVHVLVRGKEEKQLNALAQRVRNYKYDSSAAISSR